MYNLPRWGRITVRVVFSTLAAGLIIYSFLTLNGGPDSLLQLLAGLLMIPIEEWQTLISRKLGGFWIKVIVIVLLLGFGFYFHLTEDPEDYIYDYNELFPEEQASQAGEVPPADPDSVEGQLITD